MSTLRQVTPATRRRALAAAAAVMLSVCVAANSLSPVSAQESAPTWSVQPGTQDGPDGRSALDVVVDAGSSIDDTIVVTNHSDFEVTFGLYAADAVNNIEDGSFALIETPEENADLGSWTTFAASPEQSRCNDVPLPEGCPPLPAGATALTLQGGETAVIPVHIVVPHDARPGDHSAGLIAAWYSTSTGGDGQPLTLEQRVGARAYVRVNGALDYRAEVSGLTGGFSPTWNPFSGDTEVRYHLDNTGNVRLHSDQVIVLTGPFGVELARSEPIRAEHLNPGQRIAVTHTFSGIAPLFALDATVYVVPTGSDGVAAPVIEQHLTVWAIPWLLIGLLLLVGGVLWLVLFRRRRHRQRLAATIEQARAEAFAEARVQDTAAQSRPAPASSRDHALATASQTDTDNGGER